MTRPVFVLDRLMTVRWIGRARTRRAILGALAVLLALLALFPQRYRAVAKFSPSESGAQDPGAVVGNLGASYGTLLAAQPAETDMTVARSYDVLRDVAGRLKLVTPQSPQAEVDRAVVRLERDIDVTTLRGGILQIERRDADPAVALTSVDAFAAALGRRLSVIAERRVADRRGILDRRLIETERGVRDAERDLAAFRRTHGSPATQEQSSPDPTDDPLPPASPTDRSAVGSGDTGTRPAELARKLAFAQASYRSYARYLEGSAGQELADRSGLERLESTHIDPHRHYNPIPLGLLIVDLLLMLMAEAYLLAPPAGARIDTGEPPYRS